MNVVERTEDEIISEAKESIRILRDGLGFEDIRIRYGDQAHDSARRIVSVARKQGWMHLIYPKREKAA